MSLCDIVNVEMYEWEEWLSGKCALSLDDNVNFDGFIDLGEYETRLLSSTWGTHEEDVIEAGCVTVDDMECEAVWDLSDWYGGRFEGWSGMYYWVNEPSGNDGINLLAIENDEHGKVTIAIGCGRS